jgi:DNA-binding transcriptional LysR family regulator
MSANFTLVQLRHFCEAARVGSMSEAAKRLHVSQPALSASITALERDLGVGLFERVPRKGVRLTRAGYQFYEDAIALVHQAEVMRENVGNFAGVLHGTLRVGMYLPVAPFRAPSLLQAFARSYPEVSVDIVEADHAELDRMVREEEIDIALAYSMTSFDGLRTEVIETIPPHAIVPSSHHLARKRGSVSLQAFASEPLVLLDLPYTSNYYLSLFEKVGVEPNVRFRVQGYETARGLVARGFGVSVMNQRLGHDLTYSGIPVVMIELADDLPPLNLVMVTLPEETETRRVEAFRQTCHKLFGR